MFIRRRDAIDKLILLRNIFIFSLIFVLFGLPNIAFGEKTESSNVTVGVSGGNFTIFLSNGTEVTIDIDSNTFEQEVSLDFFEPESLSVKDAPPNVIAVFSVQIEGSDNITLKKPIRCKVFPKNGIDMNRANKIRACKLESRKNGETHWDRGTIPYIKGEQSPAVFDLIEFGTYMIKYSKITLGSSKQNNQMVQAVDFNRGDKFFKLSEPCQITSSVKFQLKLNGVENIDDDISLKVEDEFGNKIYDRQDDGLFASDMGDNWWEFTVGSVYFPNDTAGKYSFFCKEPGLWGREFWEASIIRDWPSIANGNESIIKNLLDFYAPVVHYGDHTQSKHADDNGWNYADEEANNEVYYPIDFRELQTHYPIYDFTVGEIRKRKIIGVEKEFYLKHTYTINEHPNEIANFNHKDQLYGLTWPWVYNNETFEVLEEIGDSDDPYMSKIGVDIDDSKIYASAYEYNDSVFLQYWFYYPYDPKNNKNIISKNISRHTSDRERIIVVLDKKGHNYNDITEFIPKGVLFFHHLNDQGFSFYKDKYVSKMSLTLPEFSWNYGNNKMRVKPGEPGFDGAYVSWNKVERSGRHPHVYIAQGSHACYFREGSYSVDVAVLPSYKDLVEYAGGQPGKLYSIDDNMIYLPRLSEIDTENNNKEFSFLLFSGSSAQVQDELVVEFLDKFVRFFPACRDWYAAHVYYSGGNSPNNVSKDLSDPTITNALNWLYEQQLGNGSWSNEPAVTSLAVLAMLNWGYDENDPVVHAGLDYLLNTIKVNDDGSFHNVSNRYTYYTSIAILPLIATRNDDYKDEIRKMRDWLIESQWDEDSFYASINTDNVNYGGFGYGNGTRADLSNTQWALMGIKAADEYLGLNANETDETYDKATELFLKRCQNSDGGSSYTPYGESIHTMTAASVWSYRLCGVGSEEPAVADGLEWLADNYSLISNDGNGRVSDYYYALTFAKALTMSHKTKLGGFLGFGGHDWFEELSEQLMDWQTEDGNWPGDGWLSGQADLELTTCYSILSLQTRTLPQNADLSMSIILESHADVHVYDPQGRHMGVNYDTMTIEENIPGATFKILDADDNEVPYDGSTPDDGLRQVITLPVDAAGSYRVELVGTSDGPFDLTINGEQDGKIVTTRTYDGEIHSGENLATTVTVTAMEGAMTLLYEPLDVLPIMEATPNKAQLIVEPDTVKTFTFTVNEVGGQEALHSVSVYCTDITGSASQIPGSDVTFDINNFDVPAGGDQIVNANIPIPAGFKGSCMGSIIIESADGGTKSVQLTIENQFIISLIPGWNLISLCKQPPDNTIPIPIDPIIGKYSSLWAFQNKSWKVYDPDHPGFSDLTTMEAGWGYWINMTETGTLTVTGTEPSKSLDLIRGWNLVGYNSCTPQPIADALKSIEGKYISVWLYINGQWKVYDPANPGFSDLDRMEPGYGYWIKTTQNCTWTLP